MRYILPRIRGSMAGYGEGSGVNRNATQVAARISRCRDVFRKAVRGRKRKNIKTRESYVVSLGDVTRKWLQSRLEAIEEITDKDVLEKDIGLREPEELLRQPISLRLFRRRPA